MKTTTIRCLTLVLLSGVIAGACDSSPLVAPIASTISLTSSAAALQPGGAAALEAYVIEEAGTPVHDGTVVRFSATLGTVNPVEAKTEDGVARATFTAGAALGTATIVALSGGATAGADQPNSVEIVIAN